MKAQTTLGAAAVFLLAAAAYTSLFASPPDAFLFLIYSGALLVRGLSADPQRGARLAAVIGVIGFLDVPVIHYSVVWFRTLHQPASIAPGSLKIAPPMLLALMLSLLAFTVLFAYLLRLRARLAWLEAGGEP